MVRTVNTYDDVALLEFGIGGSVGVGGLADHHAVVKDGFRQAVAEPNFTKINRVREDHVEDHTTHQHDCPLDPGSVLQQIRILVIFYLEVFGVDFFFLCCHRFSSEKQYILEPVGWCLSFHGQHPFSLFFDSSSFVPLAEGG